MRLVKLIGPAMLTAAVAVFASHANAQTMGEYATTTAAASSGASSMGTSIGSAVGNVSDDAGGSSTWGASSLGASFEERAGGASGLGAGGNFDSRAGSLSGGSDSQSRWPGSAISTTLKIDSPIRQVVQVVRTPDSGADRTDSPNVPTWGTR